MSFKHLKTRLRQIEERLTVAIVTIRLRNGGTYRIPDNALLTTFCEAMKVAAPYGTSRVPAEAVAGNARLEALMNMEDSDEDGSLLKLAQVILEARRTLRLSTRRLDTFSD